MSNDTSRTQALDICIEVMATEGYARATETHLAQRSELSLAAFRRLFPQPESWIVDAFDHLMSRRVAMIKALVENVHAPAGDQAVVDTLVRTVMSSEGVDPLFAATYEFFFMTRGDAELASRLAAIRDHWEPQINQLLTALFPAGSPAGLITFVMAHLEGAGASVISNGSQSQISQDDLLALRTLLSGCA